MYKCSTVYFSKLLQMDISKTLRNIVLFFLKFMAQCKTFIWRRMGGKWNLNGKWMQMLVTFILLIHPN